MKDFDFGTIFDWNQKRIHILTIINEFPWEQKRDFQSVISNIDKIASKWDLAKVDYRRQPNTTNTIKMSTSEKEFNQVIKLLKKELLISKLCNY
jgi:hypothetical protein